MNDKITTRHAEKSKRPNGSIMSNGKLIDPTTLTGYSKVLPTAPERILLMNEEDLRHRHWLEKTTLRGNLILSFLGILFAAFLTICFLIGGVLCIINGHEVAGSVLIGAPLVSIVTAFIYGTKNQ